MEWQEEFQSMCEEMKKNNEIKRSLSERGEIVWCPDLKCPNCHNQGTFYGYDLEYGEFYECASAHYCLTCKKVYNISAGINFASYGQDRFLPIMKKKLIANPQICKEPSFLVKGICPICKGNTHTFQKDLGAIDYYDNFWKVCVNPNCKWPGEHYETHELSY
jgi:hypothetical protein